MRTLNEIDFGLELPAGFYPVPVQASEAGSSFRLSLILRETPDAAAGHFVIVRQTVFASVYLGCLTDTAARIHEFLEIWVQNRESPGGLAAAREELRTNRMLDQTWERLADDLRQTEPEGYLETGFRRTQPLPVLIDGPKRSVRHPVEKTTGAPWELCLDDATLSKAGLPPYTQSLHRYLHVPSAGPETRSFVPVTAGAPENERTLPAASFLEPGLIPFNLPCGLLLVRSFSPFSVEDFSDLLAGQPWRGLENSKKPFFPSSAYNALQNPDFLRSGEGHLFSLRNGQLARIPEFVHLKLEVLRQALKLAREYTKRTQLPLLNVTAESFRASLARTGAGLPFLWTFQMSLVVPGEAFALPIPNSTIRFFQPLAQLPASIYRPDFVAIPIHGTANVRVRTILPKGADGTVAEGTFSTHERVPYGRNDLLNFQIPLRDRELNLFCYLDSADAMARGEASFRTVPQNFSESDLAGLASVKGVPFQQRPFDVLPPLSSPTDLYSLGVLAVRLLLANPTRPLPDAFDAFLSLARELANIANTATDVNPGAGARVRTILECDPRWLDALGPHHLLAEPLEAAKALGYFPMNLWCDILAAIATFFPGIGPDSECKDFGDAPGLAPHMVYEQPGAKLDRLSLRVRSLLLLDWRSNQEVAGIIRSLLPAE